MRAAASSGQAREPDRYRPRLTEEIPASAASSSRSKMRSSPGTSRSGSGDCARESSSRSMSPASRLVSGLACMNATAASRPIPAVDASCAILRRSARSSRWTGSGPSSSPRASARRSSRIAGSTRPGRSSGGATVEIWTAAIYQSLTGVREPSSVGPAGVCCAATKSAIGASPSGEAAGPMAAAQSDGIDRMAACCRWGSPTGAVSAIRPL